MESKSKSKVEVELKEQVMALRIREASLVSDLNEIRQKLMERETQVRYLNCLDFIRNQQ